MKITLAGSKWLYETTARWRAEHADAKLDLDKQRLAVNKELNPPRDPRSPLERMHAAQQLDKDLIMNGILHGAGVRYYQDWYLSGLSGISAFDYDKVGGSGAKDGLPQSEMQVIRRQSLHKARECLGEKYLEIVDPIVLEERPAHEIRHLTGYSNLDAGRAVVLERLNAGLRKLAVNYGLLRS